MNRNFANYLLPLCLWTLDNWLWIEFSWRVSINFNCRKYNAYKMTPLCCYITGGSLQHTLQHHCRPPSASLSPAPSPGHPPPVQEAAGAAGGAGGAGGNLDLWARSWHWPQSSAGAGRRTAAAVCSFHVYTPRQGRASNKYKMSLQIFQDKLSKMYPWSLYAPKCSL